MSAPDWTPGPWWIDEESIGTSAGIWIDATVGPLTVHPAQVHGSIADARLISAVPDLYEALADAPVLSKYHGHQGFEVERFIADYEAWMARRRAVMGKARGEPQPPSPAPLSPEHRPMNGALAEIIARLESATEGSRELDALIWATVLPRDGQQSPLPLGDVCGAPKLIKRCHWEYEPQEDGLVKIFAADKKGRIGFEKYSRYAPHFTTSADAALSLVDPDATWTLGRWLNGTTGSVYWFDYHIGGGAVFPDETFQARHKSRGIAIVIAALRARETHEKTGQVAPAG